MRLVPLGGDFDQTRPFAQLADDLQLGLMAQMRQVRLGRSDVDGALETDFGFAVAVLADDGAETPRGDAARLEQIPIRCSYLIG